MDSSDLFSGGRLAFVIWLYVVTDGAAFSPFAFLGGAWQPLLTALGLAEFVVGVGAVVLRGHRRRSAGGGIGP